MRSLSPDELAHMTPPERLALIAQLWDSLEQDDVPLTAEQQRELERRLDALSQDRRDAISWAELKAELQHRRP